MTLVESRLQDSRGSCRTTWREGRKCVGIMNFLFFCSKAHPWQDAKDENEPALQDAIYIQECTTLSKPSPKIKTPMNDTAYTYTFRSSSPQSSKHIESSTRSSLCRFRWHRWWHHCRCFHHTVRTAQRFRCWSLMRKMRLILQRRQQR
jgi:hypothetical protein